MADHQQSLIATRTGQQLDQPASVMRVFGSRATLGMQRSLRAAAVLLSLACASTTFAVTVVMNDSGKTLHGFLVRDTGRSIIFNEVLPDGSIQQREVLKSDALILNPIDADRLAELSPDEPQSYRIYAEELAEKRADPDARQMSLRLYLISAHLDKENLGRSSLLGMAALARNASERRRFRAMVYLLDDTHDRQFIQRDEPGLSPTASASSSNTSSDETVDAGMERVILALQYLRQGKTKEARNLSRRAGFDAIISMHPEILNKQQFDEATSPRCPQCEFGKETCPACRGEGRVDGRVCLTCKGRKSIECQRCAGNYLEPVLPNHLLNRVVRLELVLRGETDLVDAAAPKDNSTPWSKLLRQRRIVANPRLTLETITEFDPSQSIFRNGEWRAP